MSARELLADLPELAKRLPSSMLLVVDAYSRAVLADAAALAGHTRAWPLDRARLQLHHGRRLRRLRRTSAAREPLREARDTFDALAAEGLTNRQIAKMLYLSHWTVGSRLYRSYPRLGISSRVELAGAISAIN
ncbi:LuxR C-terminal-related transcriptional regulator [Nocardia goodfellowii]